MHWGLLRAIIILPGTALIFAPGALLWAAAGTRWEMSVAPADGGILWLGIVAGIASLPLMAGTARLLVKYGEGTPAPWEPPQKLVVMGPYRFVRNPMISGVLLCLSAESLILQSWPIFWWLMFFYAANAVYFPLSEEKGLERRFGDDYRLYKQNVPRWIPRLRPWTQPD